MSKGIFQGKKGKLSRNAYIILGGFMTNQLTNSTCSELENENFRGQKNTDSTIVELTDKALEKILELASAENVSATRGLRLGVIGGGCSGLSYKMEFSDIKEKDNVIDYGNVKVFIDPKSTIYLKGIRLDYKDGLNGKGFVFENPNATNTCGCGESFSV